MGEWRKTTAWYIGAALAGGLGYALLWGGQHVYQDHQMLHDIQGLLIRAQQQPRPQPTPPPK